MLNWLYGTAVTYTLAPMMSTLQVLPTRTFIVKLSVCLLIGPDSTSNATICSRAGGASSAIGAGFALLLVGQPFGPGAAVAAIPTAARAASASAVTAATTRGLAITPCRNRRYHLNRSTVSP
jgi:hypothetical protein